MLKFVLGAAGTGKSEYLMREIKRLVEMGKKVIFVVPEQFSFQADRKLYNYLGAAGFNSIRSRSFTSLSKEIFSTYGGRSGEYAEDIHKYILMNKAVKTLLERKDLSYYTRQAKRSSFIGDAIKIINEFRQCGISSEELTRVSSAENGLSEKVNDLSVIYSEYDRLLKENDLKDQLSNISEAAAEAAIHDHFLDSIVVFDEFESFTGDEYEMIETMLSQCEHMYIALRMEDKKLKTRSFGIFASVEKTYKSFLQLAAKYNMETSDTKLSEPIKYKNEDLAFLNRNILRSKEIKPFKGSESIKIVECRDFYEEADYVCASIKRLVRDEGYRYRDIVVISRQLSDYVFILEAAYSRYEIPNFMDTKKKAFHTLVMQLVLNVVNVICEKKLDSETILRYIKTSFSEFDLSEISALENYSFEWNIEGEAWFEPFTAEADRKPYIEKMRDTLMTPVKKYRERCKGVSGREACRLVYGFMYERKIPLRVGEAINALKEDGFIFEAKEQKRMWDTLMDILETFYKLESDISVREFRELISAVIRNMTYSLPPQRVDELHTAHAEAVRVDSPKVVFVIGANEGIFPMSVGQGGLLSDKDRMKFQESGLRLSRDSEELVSDETLMVYKSLTYAADKLFITYPLSDNSGNGRFPSSVIKQTQELFADKLISSAADEKPEFYAQTPASAYYTYIRNFGRKGTAEIEKMLSEYPLYSSKIEYLKELTSQKDFEIKDKELMKRLYTKRLSLSPTGLEEFYCCHFKYFCDRGLKLRALKKHVINSLEHGNIVHRCLEAVLSSCSTKEEFDSLTREQIEKLSDKCSDEYVNENIGVDIENDLRNSTFLAAIKHDIYELICHLQKELSQSQFRPVEFEYRINAAGQSVLCTDSGVEIILSGSIDRVDILEKDGKKYIRVIDYKTGTKKFDIASLQYGINMQMLIYLFTVTSQKEKYFDCEPAGVLYMPSGELVCGNDRDSSKTPDEYRDSSYKMNGVVLKDRAVLSSMEKEIAGVYIPAKLLKSDPGTGEPSLDSRSEVFTQRQFSNLRKFVKSKITDLADKIYDGCIDACAHSFKGITPCSYCDYKTVCGERNKPVDEDVSAEAKEYMKDMLEKM